MVCPTEGGWTNADILQLERLDSPVGKDRHKLALHAEFARQEKNVGGASETTRRVLGKEKRGESVDGKKWSECLGLTSWFEG